MGRRQIDMDADKRLWKAESGIGLIETLLALLILIVGLSAVMSLFAVSMTFNHEQGNVGSRASSFAEAKMEELLALTFTDNATDTTVWPPTTAVNTGLCGELGQNASCGGVNPAAPVLNFADYLDFQGKRVPANQAFFTRQWQIQMENAATRSLKTVTVRVTAKRRLNGAGTAPFTALISYKARIQ
jgi:hypothetical protein